MSLDKPKCHDSRSRHDGGLCGGEDGRGFRSRILTGDFFFHSPCPRTQWVEGTLATTGPSSLSNSTGPPRGIPFSNPPVRPHHTTVTTHTTPGLPRDQVETRRVSHLSPIPNPLPALPPLAFSWSPERSLAPLPSKLNVANPRSPPLFITLPGQGSKARLVQLPCFGFSHDEPRKPGAGLPPSSPT